MVRKRLCKLIAASALALAFSPVTPFYTSPRRPRRRSRHAVQTREGGSHLLRRQHASRPDAAFWMAGDADLQPLPRQELVFRDLGYSGDEINHRERCDGFGIA